MPNSEEQQRPSHNHEPSFTQALTGHLSDGLGAGGTGRGRQPETDKEITSATGHKIETDGDDEKSTHSSDLGDDGDEDRHSVNGANPDPESGVSRAQSRASSARSRPIVIVPASERRGLLGRFTLLPEVTQPYDYKNGTKWFITILVAICGFCAPVGSAIFFPALQSMAADLNASLTITNFTVAFYMLSMGVFPIWWSSFADELGRRSIYITSFSLFVVFSVLSAISSSIGMLIVMRILAGGAAASAQAVGAGTIADIWEPIERGKAMGIFYLGPIAGPLIGPLIGGALAQRWDWRATMWFTTIYGGVTTLLLIFGLPETLPRAAPGTLPSTNPDAATTAPPLTRTSTTASAKVHTKRIAAFFKRALLDPLKILLYLRYPSILIVVAYASITFGCLYVLNVVMQSAYHNAPYNYSQLTVGLLFIPCSMGYVLASIFGGRWIDYIMAREARRAGRRDEKGKLIYLPEDRMRENAWVAAVMFPGALIWFGWSASYGLHVAVLAIAAFTFGFGSMLVFGAATTMLTEFMPPGRSSAGIAVNNFVRNLFACIGGIVAQPLIDAMGYGWLCTTFGLVAFVGGSAAIFAMRRCGPRWRASMDVKMAGAAS